MVAVVGWGLEIGRIGGDGDDIFSRLDLVTELAVGVKNLGNFEGSENIEAEPQRDCAFLFSSCVSVGFSVESEEMNGRGTFYRAP